MAQRTEKEENEFKVPETFTLCINNCGLTGNPATGNMCQKCFSSKNSTPSSSTSSSSIGLIPMTSSFKLPSSESKNSRSSFIGSSERSLAFTASPFVKDLKERVDRTAATVPVEANNNSKDNNEDSSSFSMKRSVNRCSGCRKKVGLTGFRCRCGELFCSQHRYSDRHDCSYDYKAAGREAIARDNPVVRAPKLIKL